jgi:hypothetical protein
MESVGFGYQGNQSKGQSQNATCNFTAIEFLDCNTNADLRFE